ncbi:MAG: 6,7-dimethyl-8-ribityllumazine synthase [Alphaproteobacteria bacterium]|nr:6,7-dimethyl-8-ribityllumazine synthase [Alphaproteobacteria bacterium]
MAVPNILIVEARYYEEIADELLQGARVEIDAHGASHETVTVPGAFEIPAAIRAALDGARRRYSAYVALGCVIRGETDHHEHVARACVQGLSDLVTRESIVVGFGVLTCHTFEQAMERAAIDRGNKGAEAVRAAFTVLDMKRAFERRKGQ